MVKLIKYINEIIGLEAEIGEWKDISKLPYFLQQGKSYKILNILGITCLLIKIELEDFSISTYEKQQIQLKKIMEFPIILYFEKLTAYQRKALLERNLSFVVPGSQLYIPFLAVVLQEYYRSSPKRRQKMKAMTQMIFLYLLYHPEKCGCSKTTIASLLNISTMNVTRSIQELQALDLVNTQKQGRISLVYCNGKGKELFDRAQPHFQNPVRKSIYVRADLSLMELPATGDEALSFRSRLKPTNSKIRALWKKDLSKIDKSQYVDPDWVESEEYIELEIWQYNPAILAQENIVDPISLALSLKHIKDERVEAEIERMIEEIKW